MGKSDWGRRNFSAAVNSKLDYLVLLQFWNFAQTKHRHTYTNTVSSEAPIRFTKFSALKINDSIRFKNNSHNFEIFSNEMEWGGIKRAHFTSTCFYSANFLNLQGIFRRFFLLTHFTHWMNQYFSLFKQKNLTELNWNLKNLRLFFETIQNAPTKSSNATNRQEKDSP